MFESAYSGPKRKINVTTDRSAMMVSDVPGRIRIMRVRRTSPASHRSFFNMQHSEPQLQQQGRLRHAGETVEDDMIK